MIARTVGTLMVAQACLLPVSDTLADAASLPFAGVARDVQPRYDGPGHTGSAVAPDADGLINLAGGPFPANNVTLLSWLSLADFGPFVDSGNDCWGYVSPSGREYALMTVANQMAVVEITDPINPVIVGSVSHPSCLWGDVKVYQDFAYVVTDVCGGVGIQVVSLTNVDAGVVSLVNTVNGNGETNIHNLAIDTDSGFLYLCIPNINAGRVVAYDLSNPANPVLAGQMTAASGGNRLHDAQAVTFTTGPNAGKQILFGAGESRGVDIYDVTNKSNMFRISRTTYPALTYCHQCWLGLNQQFLYVDDELDNINRTTVFDVSDLANPIHVNDYNSGVPSIDHNVYYNNGFVFEAEYTAGLRVFCADDPINPVQVGWFDTHPENDNPTFGGAWSVYPFFPSGNVLISDETRGLFVVDPSVALDQPPCGTPPPPPPGIPAASDWGIVSMSLLLMTGGTIVFRRRRAPVC